MNDLAKHPRSALALGAASAALIVSSLFCIFRRDMTAAEIRAGAGLASIRARQGDFEASLEVYRRLLGVAGDSPYLRLGQAETLCGKGYLIEAARVLRKLLAEDPDAPLALYDLGETLYRLGEREESRLLLLRFVARYGDSLPWLAARARARLASMPAARRNEAGKPQ
jgi:tetratricopeptide (TPR) repeat protein